MLIQIQVQCDIIKHVWFYHAQLCLQEGIMAEIKMLAIDLGASSGRGIIGAFDGNKLTLRENHRFSNDPVFVNGRFTWDILRIFFEIKSSITSRQWVSTHGELTMR